MAKRELSSTLRNLKFMQRAGAKEEKPKQEEEVKPDGNFFSPGAVKKCVVIMEGDPHPGAVIGRMSFQSFNPSIDKIKAAANPSQPEVSGSPSDDRSIEPSFREDASPEGGSCSNADKLNLESNGDLKRKQAEVESKSQCSNESVKNVNKIHQSSPGNGKGFKKPKHEKLDWNVLRSSKAKQKK